MNHKLMKASLLSIGYFAAFCFVSYFGYQAYAKMRTSALMAEAASKFIASLSAEQKAKAVLAFKDDARDDWEFFPRQRKGLPLKEMTLEQRRLAHAFLRTGLSNYGYLKASAIMQMEPILGALEDARGNTERRPFRRDEELYFFAIFGTPGANEPWGWRIEGHHISLHFTLVSGELVSNTPLGFGSNPAEVREGPRAGFRPLANEEDRAREAITALDDKQRNIAIFNKSRTPGDLFTMSKRIIDPLKPAGIGLSQLNAEQREKVMAIVEEYLDRMPDEIAKQRRDALTKAGLNTIYFGWAGSVKPGEAHYYRVQGKTFLIEYDHSQNPANDTTQLNPNHIHSVWRDFNGDFGRDWLGEHYKNVPHNGAR
ncbi:MAG: DUF3500 domain-containing protein [Acidobacteria bacterium]|nr:DUF3500 domain-containing protein [Acidobacteriota bacterium]MBI3426258.1 DUF3500 domain-containing protein [Acidobacteriota bacterium]